MAGGQATKVTVFLKGAQSPDRGGCGKHTDTHRHQAPEELLSLRFLSADLLGLYLKAAALLENDTVRHAGLPRPRTPLPV